MKLFFEDVEINEESPMIFAEDASGLLAVSLESEMAWNNLETTMMKEEFTSIIKEDVKMLGASKESMFKRMITMFTELMARFKQAINSLLQRMQVQFVNGEKFLAKYAKEINAFQDGDKTVNIYEWKINRLASLESLFPAKLGSSLQAKIKEAVNAGKAKSSDELASALMAGVGVTSLSSMDEAVIKGVRSIERKEIKVNRVLVAKSITDIKGAKSTISHLKTLAKEAEKLVEIGKKEALEGLTAVKASDEQVQKNKTIAASTAKSAVTFINKVVNLFVKITIERFTDCLSAVRSAISSQKTTQKNIKKATKEFKKDPNVKAPAGTRSVNESAKIDSIIEEFGLTLEDFEDEVSLDESFDLEDE